MEWMRVLELCVDNDSFIGADYRLDVISAVLIENEFGKWADLKFAEDPAQWDEAEKLSESELAFLRKFMEAGQQVPQYACVARVCLVGFVCCVCAICSQVSKIEESSGCCG